LYLNRHLDYTKFLVQIALVIPDGDEIWNEFRNKTTIVQGPENDVLARYHQMAEKLDADYIVRITGDCPMIIAPLITKHINTGVRGNYDYISNVDEESRTVPDGWDCEFFSRKMLRFAFDNATQAYDREHVTTFMRREPPSWAKTAAIVGYLDLSALKISVDTEEDLEQVRLASAQIDEKLAAAEAKHGKSNVHRF
jgi:spore coat polysaccharide biosynthesis protein SpsF